MVVFLLLIVGLFIGSFLNVLIDRLPEEEDVIRGRSHCDHCKRNLSWSELIPVLSYLFQNGRSRCCRRPLSLQYPLIELVTGIGFAAITFGYIQTLGYDSFRSIPLFDYSVIPLFAYLLIFCSFLVIFVADLKTQIIPDSMVVAAIIGILLLKISTTQLPVASINYQLSTINLLTFLSPALGAALFIYLIWLGTRGRGMGFGDVKLIFPIGLLTGYPGVILALYGAFLTGAAVGVILVIAGKKGMKSHIAFGPFLLAGMVIALIFADVFGRWWKGVMFL